MNNQINIFELTKPRYTIEKPIRLIELFAGIGSQAKALKNLNTNFENYQVIEFDKYAIASYNAIYGTNFATQDITQISGSDLEIVDTDKYEYILTYSFPCQDLSLAGKRKGMAKGDNTRSSLLWEVERLLDECTELPQILLMENVPQVISQANISDFQKWQYKLEQLGYSNYVQLLNAKDYGIPQNRNRCFMVSILGDFYYKFPRKQKLKLRLKDMLEDEVDKKYYLSERALKGVLNTTFECSKLENRLSKNDIIPTLCARDYKDPKLILVGNMAGEKWDNINESARRVYSEDGVSTAITTSYMPSIAIPEATKKGYALASEGDGVYINRPHQKRGCVQKGMIQTVKCQSDDIGVVVEKKETYLQKSIQETINNNNGDIPEAFDLYNRKPINDGISKTIGSDCGHLGTSASMAVSNNLRIRKLTPKECWRLMGFSDEDFEKASKVNSNAQLYKQAGNSIVVNVLEAIFKELLANV